MLLNLNVWVLGTDWLWQWFWLFIFESNQWRFWSCRFLQEYTPKLYRNNQNRHFQKQTICSTIKFLIIGIWLWKFRISWNRDKLCKYKCLMRMFRVDFDCTSLGFLLTCFIKMWLIPHQSICRIHIWTYLSVVNLQWTAVRK